MTNHSNSRTVPLQLVTLIQTNEACPTEWFGTDRAGKLVIIHYRSGRLIIRVAENWHNRMDAVSGRELFSDQVDRDSLRGSITFKRLKDLTKHILKLPRDGNAY